MKLLIVTLGILFCCRVEAQALQYLDEAGNIHYADSIEQVPTQYRKQLGVDPNPPAVLVKGKGKAAAKKRKAATAKGKKKKGKKSSGKKGKKGSKKPAPAATQAANPN